MTENNLFEKLTELKQIAYDLLTRTTELIMGKRNAKFLDDRQKMFNLTEKKSITYEELQEWTEKIKEIKIKIEVVEEEIKKEA